MRNYAIVGFAILVLAGVGGVVAINQEMWLLAWTLGYAAFALSTLLSLLAFRRILRSGSTQNRQTKSELRVINRQLTQSSTKANDLHRLLDSHGEQNQNLGRILSALEKHVDNLAMDVGYKVSRFGANTTSPSVLRGSGAAPIRFRPRVLVVNFDAVLNGIIKRRPDTNFNESFYESDVWPDKPNSTPRLNLANYQALRKLTAELDIDFIFHSDLPENISKFFDAYSAVIVMQSPSRKSLETLKRILNAVKQRPTRAKLIFGTELTWFAELERGNLNREQIREVYTRNTLLRHTARTDMRIYQDDTFDNANIQEFEIGLDTQVIKPKVNIEDRNIVLFVKAPEGRTTKNNAAVDEIHSLIQDAPYLQHLVPVVLEPPYSTVEYWEILRQTRYLIFTSLGETFSYVLNDAKAAGVVSFFPSRMYENRHTNYSIDSYPDMPGRYSSVPQLLDRIKYLEDNSEELKRESQAARAYVVNNFSVDKLSENWRKLILDEPLNTNTLFLAQLDGVNFTLDDALATCQKNGYQFLLPYLNAGTESLPQDVYSWIDSTYGVTILRDFVYESSNGLRRTKLAEGNPATGEAGFLYDSWPQQEVLEFWRILIRVNKIGRIVTNLGHNNEIYAILQSRLRYRVNSQYPSVPIEISNLIEE